MSFRYKNWVIFQTILRRFRGNSDWDWGRYSAWNCPSPPPARIKIFCLSGFSSHLKNFHSCGDVTITGEELQILTCARHSWPLSSEGSLACHTYILWHGASIYNSHLQGPVTLAPIVERLAVELSLPVFTTWVCSTCDSNNLPSACGANVLTHCAT